MQVCVLDGAIRVWPHHLHRGVRHFERVFEGHSEGHVQTAAQTAGILVLGLLTVIAE